MAKAKNKVIAGEHVGNSIGISLGISFISTGFLSSVQLTNKNVETYELITDELRKSAKSGVARGIVGGAILGPVGMLAGGISAKSKGIYQVAVQFKDGKRSLIECDDKIYKSIIAKCF